jgi:DnaJ-class molecular chaperone
MECGGFGTITRHYGGGQFDSTIDCGHCHGRGALGNCASCGGSGVIKGSVNAEGDRECPDCRGVGAIGDCPHCGGIGVIVGEEGETECPVCDGFGFALAGE